MRITLSAAGTPLDVRAQLVAQSVTLRKQHPGAAALVAALRDQCVAQCAALAGEEAVIVEASAEWFVTAVAPNAVSPVTETDHETIPRFVAMDEDEGEA